MAGKKESTYMYNAKMSMRNLRNDIISDNFTNTKNFIQDARAGYKAFNDSRNSSGFAGIKNKIKQSALYRFVSDMTKNAFSGIKTGKFYKSEDEIMGLGDEDFGEEFFFSDSSMSDWGTDAEKEQSAQATPAPSVNGIATYSAVNRVAKGIQGSAKASQKMMMQGFMQTASSINNTPPSALFTTSVTFKAVCPT